MAEQKNVHSSPTRTPKSELAAKQPSTGECWIPPKKILHVQRHRKSSKKTVGGEQSCLKSNLRTTRDARKDKNKTLCTPGPRERSSDSHKRPRENCMSVSYRGMGQHWPAVGTQALVAAAQGGIACGISPPGGGHLQPPREPLSRQLTNWRTITPMKFSH